MLNIHPGAGLVEQNDATIAESSHRDGQPLLRYPGTAQWVLLHGPSFPVILPMMDAGVRTLQRANFAEHTGLAFAAMFNNAVMTMAIADERLLAQGKGVPDHASMMRQLRHSGAQSPGIAVLDQTLMAAFQGSAADSDTARETYYRFIVDLSIAGVQTLSETDWVHEAGHPGSPDGD